MVWRATAAAVLAIAIGVGASAPSAASIDPSQAFGVWANPRNTVHVEIGPCANIDQACGVVVWASDKAEQDARRGGTAELVGLQLFRDMVKGANGVWTGRVFVPDLNRTFSGTAESLGRTLRARGCFLRIICRSQIWTRIDASV